MRDVSPAASISLRPRPITTGSIPLKYVSTFAGASPVSNLATTDWCLRGCATTTADWTRRGAVTDWMQSATDQPRKPKADYSVRTRPSSAQFWSRYRSGAALSRIEHRSMAQLYDGSTQGGTVSSLKSTTRPREFYKALKTTKLKTPLESEEFTALVQRCGNTLDETRNLFGKLQTMEKNMNKSFGKVSQTLAVMRSVPDLTLTREELAEAKWTMANNDRSIRLLREGAEQDSLLPRSKAVPGVEYGSIRHIFPLINFRDGSFKRPQSAKTTWRH